jgi:hypothetical protein
MIARISRSFQTMSTASAMPSTAESTNAPSTAYSVVRKFTVHW